MFVWSMINYFERLSNMNTTSADALFEYYSISTNRVARSLTSVPVDL